MESNRLSQLMTLTCGGELSRPVTRAKETMLAVLAIVAALALSSLWGIAAGSASPALAIANAYKVPMVILLSALTALPAGLVALRLTNAKLTASELAGAFALVYGAPNPREHAGTLRLPGSFLSGRGVGPGLQTSAAAAYRRVLKRWQPNVVAESEPVVDYYRAARAVVEGLKRSKGRAGAPLQAGMPRAINDPYGRMRLDNRRQAVHDQWVLQATANDVRPVANVPAVDQAFGGVFGPKKPPPGRAFPACVKRKLPWQGKLKAVKNGRVTTQPPKG